MREIGNLVLVLTCICVAAAAALARVYSFTKEPIAQSERLEKIAALQKVLPKFDNQPDDEKYAKTKVIGKDKRGRDITVTFYQGYQGEQKVGTALEVSSQLGYSGEISLMLGIKPNGEIAGIRILKQAETPGLGTKITESKFIDQFKGKSLQASRIQVKKDGGDIDQITGATISPRAVCDAIQKGLKLYQEEFGTG